MSLVVKRFTAKWCQPCLTLAPIISKLQLETSDVTFITIDVDEDSEQAHTYGVRSIPYVVFEKDGKVVETLAGIHPVDEYKQLLNKHK